MPKPRVWYGFIGFKKNVWSFLIGGSNTQGSLLSVEIFPHSCRPKIAGAWTSNIKNTNTVKSLPIFLAGDGKIANLFLQCTVNHYSLRPVLFLHAWLTKALFVFVLDVPVGDLAATLLQGKLFVCGGRYGIFLLLLVLLLGVGKCWESQPTVMKKAGTEALYTVYQERGRCSSGTIRQRKGRR